MTPSQAELVARAEGQGMLSLSLRPLGDGQGALADNVPGTKPVVPTASDFSNSGDSVSIIRYGIFAQQRREIR